MNNAKLQGCKPELVYKVTVLMTRMQAKGYPMVVTEGKRSKARQAWLWAQGRFPPFLKKRKVTWTMKSRHLTGDAADLAFASGKKGITYDGPWEIFGSEAVKLGLRWGGTFKAYDACHVELV